MNAMTEIQPQSHSAAFSALMLELAKCLKLVAPITMSADAQMVWLQAAVDALEGIHAQEVASISAELRRSVTRPAQIVPEIAKLVAEKRRRSAFAGSGQMTALQWAEGAKERNLPKHYEAWMAEARRRGEIA